MKDFKCCRCGGTVTGFPALSRVDNKSEICSDCGIIEAMQDFEGQPLDELLYK